RKRGAESGHELEDWLQAERDLFFVPHAEVHENAGEFRMTISAPGFHANDIEVLATPRELMVEAKAEWRLEPTRNDPAAGSLEFKTLYRRFGLAVPIDVDQVTARLDEGSLTIEAPKMRLTAKSVQKLQSQSAAA